MHGGEDLESGQWKVLFISILKIHPKLYLDHHIYYYQMLILWLIFCITFNLVRFISLLCFRMQSCDYMQYFLKQRESFQECCREIMGQLYLLPRSIARSNKMLWQRNLKLRKIMMEITFTSFVIGLPVLEVIVLLICRSETQQS